MWKRNNDKCVWCKLDGSIEGAPHHTPTFAPKGIFWDLYKGTQNVALKGALQVELELHLFMQLSMHRSVQYDSVKGEIEVEFYAALEGVSKISF